MRKQIVKVVVWIPVIIMAMLIFGFSAQAGEESGGLSTRVSNIIIDIADMINIIDVDETNREQYVSQISFPVRKIAHMSEYALLAIFVYIALFVDEVKYKTGAYVTEISTFVFAASDEFHQLFVPGRCGAFTDVLIDMVGATAALIICMLIDKRRKRI